MFQKLTIFDEAIDCWALGCVLLEILWGSAPFIANNVLQLLPLIDHFIDPRAHDESCECRGCVVGKRLRALPDSDVKVLVTNFLVRKPQRMTALVCSLWLREAYPDVSVDQ